MRNKLLKVKVEDWCWIYLNNKLVKEGHDFDLFDFFKSHPSMNFCSEDIIEASLIDELYYYFEDEDYEEKRDKAIEEAVEQFFQNNGKVEYITFNAFVDNSINKFKQVNLKYYYTGFNEFAYLIQKDLTQIIRDGWSPSYIECSQNCFERIQEVIPNQVTIKDNKNYYKTDYGYEIEIKVRNNEK